MSPTTNPATAATSATAGNPSSTPTAAALSAPIPTASPIWRTRYSSTVRSVSPAWRNKARELVVTARLDGSARPPEQRDDRRAEQPGQQPAAEPRRDDQLGRVPVTERAARGNGIRSDVSSESGRGRHHDTGQTRGAESDRARGEHRGGAHVPASLVKMRASTGSRPRRPSTATPNAVSRPATTSVTTPPPDW